MPGAANRGRRRVAREDLTVETPSTCGAPLDLLPAAPAKWPPPFSAPDAPPRPCTPHTNIPTNRLRCQGPLERGGGGGEKHPHPSRCGSPAAPQIPIRSEVRTIEETKGDAGSVPACEGRVGAPVLPRDGRRPTRGRAPRANRWGGEGQMGGRWPEAARRPPAPLVTLQRDPGVHTAPVRAPLIERSRECLAACAGCGRARPPLEKRGARADGLVWCFGWRRLS